MVVRAFYSQGKFISPPALTYGYACLVYLKMNASQKLIFCQNEAFSRFFSIYSHDVTRVGRTDLFFLFSDYMY